jgi:hypothetical protein
MKTGCLLPGLGAVLALCGGCTTTRTLAVSNLNPTAPTFEHGVPCLQSARTNAVTVWLLTPVYRTDLRDLHPPAFRVLVKNGGDRAFDFFPDNISASSGGTAVHVFTAEEFIREIDRQAAVLVHMLDIGTAETKEKADQTEAYAAVATPGTSPGANGPVYDFSTVPHRLGEDAKEQIDEQAAGRRAEIERWRRELLDDARLMLGRHTVAPGAMAGGVVRLAPAGVGGGQPLKIVITAGGETHEFYFDVGR